LQRSVSRYEQGAGLQVASAMVARQMEMQRTVLVLLSSLAAPTL